MSIITISRQMGSLGDEIAQALSSRTDAELITRNELIHRFFEKVTDFREKHMLKESAKFFLTENRHVGQYKAYLENELMQMATKKSYILKGFGSQVIFSDYADAVHIRIIAPESERIARIRRQYKVSDQEAEQILATADKKHKRFVSTLYNVDITDTSLYHLILNTAKADVDECVASILALADSHAVKIRLSQESKAQEAIDHQTIFSDFKNPSEAEFARVLDMYHIDWKYEPKTFPVEWDAEGNVTMAFSPDFYLPKFDTYLELTTMNQKYVTAKNRKLKKDRELYPGTNVRIVYKKDFMSLIERFKMFGNDFSAEANDESKT